MFVAYTILLLMCGSFIGKSWRCQRHGTAICMTLFIVIFAFLVKGAIHH